MKKNRAILLTFDYELFLGNKSGFVENCLICPTNLLLKMFEKNSVSPALFFIDTVYIMKMEALAKDYRIVKEDLDKIRKQLINIVKQGHYIFHHIHPHWLDAKYMANDNQWDLSDTSKLTFDKISQAEQSEIMNYSDSFLKKIYSQAGSDKTPCGYRAGGLFVEPFSKIKPFFEKYNIKYDFSVIPGDKRNDNVSIHDYSNAPANRLYKFDNILNQEESLGKFIEFPISTLNIRYLTKVLNGMYFRLYKNNKKLKSFGYGQSVNSDIYSSSKNKTLKDYLSMRI
ncbi:MAG: hypothetical protein ACOCWG_05635, partial [bacterium]